MQKKDNSYRILLVDNHPITLSGIRAELQKMAHGVEVEFVGEALNGNTALQFLKDHPEINIVILDVEMDEMDGLEVAESIRENDALKNVKIVIYTNYKSRLIAAKALAIGVDGYVLKESPVAMLWEGVRHAMNGLYFIDPGLGKGKPPKAPLIKGEIQELTPWEKRVICEILKQKKDLEIARELKCTAEHIENAKRRIKEKTCSINIVGIVLYAIEHNICKSF